MEPWLTSGDFLRRSRLSAKALRLYDERGLLKPARTDRHTGYRYYGERELDRARRIFLLRGIGMPLADVADVLDMPGPQAAERVRSYWDATRTAHTARGSLVDHLIALLRTDGGGETPHEVRHRDVEPQKVLVIQRHVTVDRLPDVLSHTTRTLFDHLTRHGEELAGPVFAAYHGLVSEDSDGPVEVCAPIRGAGSPDGPVGVRIEPAHRAAWVPLTRAQATYPAILLAYDAIGAWLREHGHRASGSVREIYYPNWATAAPDEHCVDVAVPYPAARA
ncbi:MerR family transcriptional regulator [Micromonospora echinospora]|uniref:MerR family transcriptional regulator n=1 Tax=Micromonospora echinospora TaxID=1877 RepID=UPI003787A65D